MSKHKLYNPSKKKFNLLGILLISFVISVISLLIYGYFVLYNNGEKELNCKYGRTESGFSNGKWLADNPLLYLFTQANNDYNCECGIFGSLVQDDENTNLNECVYYKVSYINNKEICENYGKEYISFNSGDGSIAKGICLCNGNADNERGTICLPRDSWKEYNDERENSISIMLLPWLYMYLIFYAITFILTLLIYLAIRSLRK